MRTFLATISLFFCSQAAADVQAIVTDIEGTTTSISFVHDVLFPYARQNMQQFVLQNQANPIVAQALSDVRTLMNNPQADIYAVIATLDGWMDADKKITPLKTLQGLLWEDGYVQGAFQGHVYDDAYVQLQNWYSSNLPLYVYSSGSVYAQKLLFSHSTFGDMTPLFAGNFDTRVGSKREAASYQAIAQQIGLPAQSILFLSDTVEELDAAAIAGMQTVLVNRSGAPISSSYPTVTNFYQIQF